MTIQRHLITGDPVLLAPARAARPSAFGEPPGGEPCPFCPGNESLTPAASATAGTDGRWVARAFPNKYPASDHHEVIVESPDHLATFDTICDPLAVVTLYVERYQALSSADGVEYVSLFKNQGPMAGASITHIHSQLLAVPFTPPRIQREGSAFARARQCPLCQAIETHRRADLVIAETDSFVWLAPSSSTMANEQWLVPKRHQNEVATLDKAEKHDLATLLQASSAAMLRVASSLNWLFLNFPREQAAHVYVDAFPRRTPIAGFELSTGTFIEVIEPATTARAFRR